MSHYRDLDISSITITAPFVSPFSTSTESILYSIIDKMGSSIAGIQLADGMKIEREEESSSPYDTIAHDTVLCLRAFAKLGVEARMLLPRMDTITSILNFVIQHADARDVILCLHALGKMHFTFLPLVGVQEDDVVAINDPTKTLILHHAQSILFPPQSTTGHCIGSRCATHDDSSNLPPLAHDVLLRSQYSETSGAAIGTGLVRSL